MRFCLLLCLALTPWPAFAHAILVESMPALRATVAPGVAHVVLRFNSRIDPARSRVILRGGGAEVPLAVAAGVGADQLVADATLQPGEYVLRWQVLAIDGHITRGDLPFSVGGRDQVMSGRVRAQ